MPSETFDWFEKGVWVSQNEEAVLDCYKAYFIKKDEEVYQE